MARGKKVKSVTGATTPLPEDSTKSVADGTAMVNSLSLIPVSTNPQPTTATTTTGGSVHEGDAEPKQSKNPYVREIEKRLAKINKKRRQIEQLEAKIVHLSAEEQKTTTLINKDERAKMSAKSTLEKEHAEYSDIINSFTNITTEEEKSRSSEKAASDASLAAKIEEARKEGKETGVKEQQDVLHTLFKFLRLAGYRRAEPNDEVAENDAIEKVLVMVYSSEETATQATESMAKGSDEVVEGSENITYGRIKELAVSLFNTTTEEQSGAEVDGEAVPATTDGSAVMTEDVPPAEELAEAVPTQALTTDLANGDHAAPAATLTDDGAANAAAVRSVEETQVNAAESWENVQSSGKSWDNGAAAAPENPSNWAEESNDAAQQTPKPSESTEENFQPVPSRYTGRGRGRGDGHRGEFRGRGGFRGEFRGGRGRGGRGDFRGARGDFRGGRGDRGNPGHRGRGSWNDHRGDRPDNRSEQQAPPAAA